MYKFLYYILNLFIFYSFYTNVSFGQKSLPSIQYNQGASVNPDSSSSMAKMNGNGFLGQIYNSSSCGLNYCTASMMTATRYTSSPGPGLPSNLNISCLPTCYNLVKAYLWWSESSQNNFATCTITEPLGGTATYPTTLAGSSGHKCWAQGGTRVFRADVTAAITTNGNYTINISSGGWAVDGVTLFIIYNDPTATYQGTLVIDDGAMTAIGGVPQSHTMTGFSACGPSTYATAFAMAGDLQNNIGPTHTTTLNGVTSAFPQNFWNYDETVTTVTSGQSTSNFGFDPPGSDCWVFAATGLYFQTTSCVTCIPGTITTATSFSNVDCGICNGTATVTPSNGVLPYTYIWNDPGAQTNATATGLCIGSYSVTVTDAYGCSSAIENFTISDITSPNTLVFSTNDVSCAGQCDGIVTAITSGGTAPYTYLWNDPGLQTTNTATGLCGGTIEVVVTDANGCTDTIIASIYEPDSLALGLSGLNAICGQANGSVSVNASGGTGTYTYLWDDLNISTASTVNNLPAGTYNVTVTDASGCSETASMTIGDIPGGTATITSTTMILCNGGSNGDATVLMTGIMPPYSYAWNTTPIQTNAQATGLIAGTYEVTVTDAYGCSDIVTTNIIEPDAIVLAPLVTDASCGQINGAISLNASGGTGTYTYLWDDPNNSTTSTVNNLPAGTYNVTITDASGCSETA
ncbi:MAG TPA: hypothetical protein EYN89_11450, partial [Flavobacteriales bacterium]|nr:hypothetical protein [Flavobacteriales bacterium]